MRHLPHNPDDYQFRRTTGLPIGYFDPERPSTAKSFITVVCGVLILFAVFGLGRRWGLL